MFFLESLSSVFFGILLALLSKIKRRNYKYDNAYNMSHFPIQKQNAEYKQNTDSWRTRNPSITFDYDLVKIDFETDEIRALR